MFWRWIHWEDNSKLKKKISTIDYSIHIKTLTIEVF